MFRGCRGRPLCPAGHLPHRRGDRQVAKPSRLSTISPSRDAGCLGSQQAQPISPPVGEMQGRGGPARHNGQRRRKFPSTSPSSAP
ncbi:hypothetical protein CPT34_23785 [Rhizobium sophoriradicis]|uniref:Lytic murein transglycosylase n=1 Tax=Rhizobium sophoriradicis TaxID=1535245 RepID=A0A2A5KNK2_9HYPH|nr:hypothetical protein CPT34_23785 [Rhizobium sophoriradicis]